MEKTIAFLALMTFGASVLAQKTDERISAEIVRVTDLIQDDEILDSLVARVYLHSGLLAAFDEEMGVYEEEIHQKERNWVSSFRVGINIFSTQTFAGPNNESITNVGFLPNMGLSLVIDPEKLVNRRSYIRQADHKRKRSYQLQQDHKQRLKKEILNHYYQYLGMLETLVLKEKTLNTRKQHLSVMEVEFKNGTATYDELLVVENQYHLWQEEYTRATIEVMRKKREIEVILGI